MAESHRGSRLCVKNLPKHITVDRFRDAFAAIGNVTDAKVIKNKSGQSRQIGFIGFQSTKDAAKAKAHFNNTFLDTSRISVEFALPVGDNKLDRPWSRYSKGSSTHQKLHPEEYPALLPKVAAKTPTNVSKHKTDDSSTANSEKFSEVAMKSRNQGKFWDNDTCQVVNSKKRGGEQVLLKKEHRRFDQTPVEERLDSDSDSDDEAFQNPEMTELVVDRSDAAAGAAVTDDEEDVNLEDSVDAVEPEPITVKVDDAVSGNVAKNSDIVDVCDTARLFVRNLSFLVTEADLSALFRPFGDLLEVNVPVDDLGRSKGYGMVQFSNGASALRAMTKMDGQVFQGRLMHCLPGQAKPEPTEVQDGKGVATHKAKIEKERKANAASSHNWNSLFVRSDTAAQAALTGALISKSDMFAPGADNMAVNLALAETSVIAQTKEWLSSEAGVNIAAFDGERGKRSDTVIIVKNIPFDCDDSDIQALFNAFGQVARCVLPPTRALALIEMSSSPSARRAFSSLAYSKFRHVPLYLEWAPHNVWTDDALRRSEPHEIAPDFKDLVDEEPGSAQATLFVKNLNFASTSEDVKKVFGNGPDIRSVKIAQRTENGKTLSRGYGFIEFVNREAALEALKTKQNIHLDGHALLLSQSSIASTKSRVVRKKTDPLTEISNICRTKLVVKNVPFEASSKELRDLFQTFGRVKSCRIPTKFGGGHRGFAFVEFSSATEAENARTNLAATHLYGRHLVIGFANKSESVDELREKTAKHSTAEAISGKKRRVDDQDEFEITPRRSKNQIR